MMTTFSTRLNARLLDFYVLIDKLFSTVSN